MRVQLARPDAHVLTPEQYNQLFTMHGVTMIFLYALPVLSGFSNYLVAARTRRARHGVSAPECAVVLDLFVRRTLSLRELSLRRSAQRGLVQLRAARGPHLQHRTEHRCLRARDGAARHLDHRRLDELCRHVPAHARAGHVGRSRAGARVGHADGLGRQPARGAVGQSRILSPVARSAHRHALLRRDERRARAALAASLLDLRASVGLCGGAAGDGHRLGCAAGVLPQAAGRLSAGRDVDGRDHDGRLRCVDSPHVRDGHSRARAVVFWRGEHGDRDSERRRDLRVDRDHLDRPARVPRAVPVLCRASCSCS